MNAEIVIRTDVEAVAREAAGRFVDLARQSRAQPHWSVALSGGQTPTALYALLAEEPYRGQVPWQDVHLFWGDERCVPPDDPGSNFRLAFQELISRVPIPAGNVHRVQGELEPKAAAQAYESALREFFRGAQPCLDLVLLGLGEDGHIASLFPGSSALRETTRLAVAVEAHYQGRPAQRVTLTLPAINSARHVWFLVNGQSKAEIVRAALEDPGRQLPVQQVDPLRGQVTWLLDAAAASLLAAR